MGWRTIVINSQSKLDYKMGYMVVRGVETTRVLIDEMAVLMIENPTVSLTGCLIEVLIENKVKVVFCDSKHNPTAELIPHHGSHDCSAKIKLQAAWTDDRKALIWQEIVAEKIRKQSEFLKEIQCTAQSDLLNSYISQIKPNDSSNREGQAAKVYFNALFGMDFTRGALTPINAALNYGYSIILSAFNREITANGYLTQIGIFHDNMFNHFNLACDLMEPYRVLVDRIVWLEKPEVFEKEEKHRMWDIVNEVVEIEDKRQVFLNAIKIYTRSVFDAIAEGDISMIKFYRYCPELMSDE